MCCVKKRESVEILHSWNLCVYFLELVSLEYKIQVFMEFGTFQRFDHFQIKIKRLHFKIKNSYIKSKFSTLPELAISYQPHGFLQNTANNYALFRLFKLKHTIFNPKAPKI